MDFIYLEDGNVKITDEGKALPCVKKLINQDRSEKLLNFQNIITGIYFIYKADGLYENININHRKKIIYEKEHISKPWSNYSENKNVLELIDVYEQTALTPAKKFLEKLKIDLDKFIEFLSNIPYEKTASVDEIITIDVDGVQKEVRVQRRKKVANIDEKSAAFSSATKLLELYEKQKRIVSEEILKEKAKQAQRRSFDRREKKAIPFNV